MNGFGAVPFVLLLIVLVIIVIDLLVGAVAAGLITRRSFAN